MMQTGYGPHAKPFGPQRGPSPSNWLRNGFGTLGLPSSAVCGPLSAQPGCPDQVMSQHEPQDHCSNFDLTPYPDLVQTPVACQGIDTFSGASPLFVNLLGCFGGHTLAPFCYRRGIVGTRCMGITLRVLRLLHRRVDRGGSVGRTDFLNIFFLG